MKIEKNRKIDPNKVYKKKKKEALIFRSLEPQIPIKKNIGIKILSKKKKKAIKSTATKEKIRNNSNNNKTKQYSFTLINPFLYEVNKHKGVMKVVNKTKNKEIPSIPNEITNWLIDKKKSNGKKFDKAELKEFV